MHAGRCHVLACMPSCRSMDRCFACQCGRAQQTLPLVHMSARCTCLLGAIEHPPGAWVSAKAASGPASCAAGELSERLEQEREDNNRVPQLLTVNLASSLPWAVSKNGGVQAAPGELLGQRAVLCCAVPMAR